MLQPLMQPGPARSSSALPLWHYAERHARVYIVLHMLTFFAVLDTEVRCHRFLGVYSAEGLFLSLVQVHLFRGLLFFCH